MKIIKFLKDWTLIIAIIVGIAAYFIYTAIPVLDSTHKVALRAVEIIQPMLIFLMLFITFCRVIRENSVCANGIGGSCYSNVACLHSYLAY